jgi:purine-nucleoside phosphorylase
MDFLSSFFTPEMISNGLRLTTPILFGAIASALSSRAGVLNLAIEAKMLIGAFVGLIVLAATGSALVAVVAAAFFTSDHFYATPEGQFDVLAAHGTLAVEMETAGLYAVGAAEGIRTLTVLTVTDVPATGESLPSIERDRSFDGALSVALAALR